MKSELGAEVELIAGAGGVFEVSVDGQEIFSKKRLNRFPDESEIVNMLKEK